ncbi:hypothetical protein B0H17DRAFT_1219540 [Mycena rosella]|uniref:Proteophosphoglycan ppg4 n=1 Tax=Mycena rosella TaxID=1033263 RepID=A0AAD7BH33_MYCRO|nr:hypothetical protein B0H17DRAFT_1219540 [Mycena rosella]
MSPLVSLLLFLSLRLSILLWAWGSTSWRIPVITAANPHPYGFINRGLVLPAPPCSPPKTASVIPASPSLGGHLHPGISALIPALSVYISSPPQVSHPGVGGPDAHDPLRPGLPDLPQKLPVPAAWAAQLARLAADDLEAPPSLHALDRAAALPSLLGEVLFDLPSGRVGCTFLDGAAEEWAMDARCAEMLARVIEDVEESGKADERARDWQRNLEAEREQEQMEREQAQEQEAEREREKEAQMERDFEMQKNILSFQLPFYVLTFSTVPTATCFRTSIAVLFLWLLAFIPARVCASCIVLLAVICRTWFKCSGSLATSQPLVSVPPHNLETPPSAPPSAPSSAFAKQQSQSSSFPGKTLSSLLGARNNELSPRALRRRARSTLVDAFRAHVLPELSGRVGLFEAAGSSARVRIEDATEDEQTASPSAPGGGYPAWVARSMLRRAEARMRVLESEWPTLNSPTRSGRSHSASVSSRSPVSPSYPQFSPDSISFPVSPTSPTHPRHATFEPWSSDDESESDEDSASDGEFEGGDSGGTESDGSSVHTPESAHSIGYGHGHALDVSTSTTSSYFTCSDTTEAEEGEKLPSGSHIRRAAQSSLVHSRSVSAAHPSRHPSSSHSASRQLKKDVRERKRVQRAAKAEHIAFARMTARLRLLLAQSAATRGMMRMQKDETERLREDRGVRRRWLDGGKAAIGASFSAVRKAETFRPSGLGLWAWDASDVVEVVTSEFDGGSSAIDDRPPAYEDVVSQTEGHRFLQPASATHAIQRTRPNQPIHRTRTTLAHLDDLDLEVDLEHLELGSAELDGLDIDVDLEHLDFTESLDVDAMGLDIDMDGDMEFRNVDVFADVSGKGKGRGKGKRVPVNDKGRRDLWERRRMVAI